jgi:3-oxoadipate CoA-transferase beta subunit
MIDKVADSVAQALQGVRDGSTVLIGGFGTAGIPNELIDGLIAQGARPHGGEQQRRQRRHRAGRAAQGGPVRKIICSFPRQADSHVFDALYRSGKLELELVPQGNLAERIRAAGAGIGGFFSPTGYGTELAKGKETREIDGKLYVLERPIHGDVALIKAERGDRWGNLVYRMAARNFGPVMAMAAKHTIATVHEIVRAGRARSRDHRHARHLRQARSSARSTAPPPRPAASREPDMGYTKRTKDQLAQRVARDMHDGAYVNLGIGMPTLVANHLPPGVEIILQSENGILGMGPAPAEGQEDYDLINAGKQPVTLLPGGAFFHHADSFAMMRGGHLDICVLGAFQVSATGDLANWSTGEAGAIPAVGGAMDLAIGAKQTWVMMDLLTKKGESKLVERCTYPLTGIGCVKRVYTDIATLECTPQGLKLIDTVDGLSHAELEKLVGLPIMAA